MQHSAWPKTWPTPRSRNPPRGGNHPLWVLGHLTFVEGTVPAVIFGEPNPVAHWAPLFKPGTEPMTDASKYPPYAEILRTYKDLRARNLQILEKLGEEGLDRKTQSPPAEPCGRFSIPSATRSSLSPCTR